jgi:predicted unusual protein kinase regulating ubiquinone biosynthesis (AarF/ABC1/UbiB family)
MIKSRYRRILFFFGRAILSIIWWDLLVAKIGLRRLSQRTRPARLRRLTVQFRILAIQMGGVMIKVGQFLSARLDVLPREITDELSGLQDEVQEESFEAIRKVIESEMGSPFEEHFAGVDSQPLASASIGQVHRAQLNVKDAPGAIQPVVIKVQRPNIQQIVDTDLTALRVVSRWIHYYPPIRKRVNTPALLEEFSRSLYEEIDYLNEGKNAETFAANFANRPQVCVPKVYWSHTTRRVLTLEEIEAIKISDYKQIEAAGIERSEVAERLVDTYLKQIFEDRFFHADPHPGNLFVSPMRSPDGELISWRIVFVDFGMTGSIQTEQLVSLREILIGVGTRDVPRLIRAYQSMGLLLPGADLALLEKATNRVFDQFWGRSTTEIVSLGQQEAASFAREFGELLYELPFQVPENLIMLGRCLGILSGISTGLDPNFNVWGRLIPYARQLVENEGSGSPNVFIKEALDILRALVFLPKRAEALIERIEQGRIEVQMPEVQGYVQRVERKIHRLAHAILFAAFFAGAVQLFLADFIALAAASAGAAFLTLIWLFVGPRT